MDSLFRAAIYYFRRLNMDKPTADYNITLQIYDQLARIVVHDNQLATKAKLIIAITLQFNRVILEK
ncbi:hypothetical protein CCS41_08055 [Candidatus Fukatsuia symbiotica]|uniref:Uncharacterized protein n=1 Tax=Candidatus Fukatsuia symbiotica TaxID=1878942 RepID=A0A2U8I5N3_9GAMM|nr:hypothetical protein CCS41_08055 [Candidatus Fukatsuia symbiotica]